MFATPVWITFCGASHIVKREPFSRGKKNTSKSLLYMENESYFIRHYVFICILTFFLKILILRMPNIGRIKSFPFISLR